MSKLTKQPTIREIANEAGVSTATVSRVLNNHAAVKDKTREQVLRVISERQFSPSATARNLSKCKSSTIGVIVPELDNPFFGEILRAITKKATLCNYTVICCNTDNKQENDYNALKMLCEQRVLGLIYTPAVNYTSQEETRKINCALEMLHAPVIIVDREVDCLQYDSVFFDDTISIYNATVELIEQGHTEIAIINAALDKVLAKVRLAGYVQALQEYQIPIRQDLIFEGNYRATAAYHLTKTMLEREHLPTAVITCNNRTSMGYLKAIYESDRAQARKISQIGLDKIDALEIIGANFNYIERSGKEMGAQSFQLLEKRLQNPEKEKEIIRISAKLSIKDVSKQLL